MGNDDLRREILNQARRLLTEDNKRSPAESEELLKLLTVLVDAIERNADPKEAASLARPLARDLIQNRKLVLALKQQADELEALKKLSVSLTSSLDLQAVLDAVVTEGMRVVKNARAASIFLYVGRKLEFGAALDDQGLRNQPWGMPRPQGIASTAARSGRRIIIDDMQKNAAVTDAPADWSGSILAIPLKTNQGIVGVMSLTKTMCGGFAPSELRLLELVANQAAVAIANASLHQALRQQASTDTVTGLPNRRALDDRLEQDLVSARRNSNSFAVIMMDLDDFKSVNDKHGHAVGDRVLRTFFNYLASGLRTTDFLARYGGDELTLVLSQSGLPSARLVVEKLLEKVAGFSYDAPDGEKIRLGLSCGIAVFPIHASTAPGLIRAADEALYQVKNQCRGSYGEAREFARAPHVERA
jgi:two-component system cell cycle response regulator